MIKVKRRKPTRLGVVLSGTVEQELAEVAEVAAPKETGGVLLGWHQDGAVIVRHALEVADPRATRSRWTRGPRRTQRVVERALRELEHPLLGYVGDWHSHPAHCGPSGTDQNSIAQTSLQYELPVVLMVRLPDGTIEVRAVHAGRLLATRVSRRSSR